MPDDTSLVHDPTPIATARTAVARRRSVGLFFSTEHVRESEQFAYWGEVISQTGMRLTPQRDEAGPFRAWIRWQAFGGVTITEAAAPRHRLFRAGAGLEAAAPEYVLLVSLAADARYVFGKRDVLVSEGDGLLVDANARTVAHYGDGMRWGAIRIPRRRLRPRPTDSGPLAIHFSRHTGLGALICDYARNIIVGGAAFDAQANANDAAIVDHLCGLLSLAIGGAPAAGTAAPANIAADRLQAIEAYIDANCVDPALSPASVAARFGISVRYVDKLFKRTGRSFMATLLQRRLSACCAMLSDPDRRPIAEIARLAGFSGLTQFNRRFRATYGTTPRAWRARQR